MSKTDKELKLNIQELAFKPIDWSVYQDKIKDVKVRFNPNDGSELTPNAFNINIDDSNILKFNGTKSNNVDIKINLDMEDDFKYKTGNFKQVIENQSLSNSDSRTFQKRKAYLESKKHWTKISLNDDDSFKL